MNFVHSNSGECTKTELDLFSVPPTQKDWVKSVIEEKKNIVFRFSKIYIVIFSGL